MTNFCGLIEQTHIRTPQFPQASYLYISKLRCAVVWCEGAARWCLGPSASYTFRLCVIQKVNTRCEPSFRNWCVVAYFLINDVATRTLGGWGRKKKDVRTTTRRRDGVKKRKNVGVVRRRLPFYGCTSATD